MRPGRCGNLTPKMMKQLTCYLEKAGYGSAKAHFPSEVWTIIIQSIDCVLRLPDRYLRIDVPRNELGRMKRHIEEALQAGQAPTFPHQGYELLKHAMRLTDRGWLLPLPEVLARLSLTPAQWDLKDQIGWEALSSLWNGCQHTWRRCKLPIYLDRFSPEILDRRGQLFELFDSQGFHSSIHDRYPKHDYYNPYSKTFCWHKTNRHWGWGDRGCEMKVIIHPLDMTLWAIVTLRGDIAYYGSSFGVYPATLAGIQLMCDNVYQASLSYYRH